jgi:Flp pilus assembly protein TadB
VLGRDPGRHLAEQATSALAGLLLPPATWTLLTASGIDIGWEVPAWAGLGLAVAGFWAPSLGVHADAQARRADFRHALAAFLDLVVVGLAGGAGVDGAMDAAASVGTGWPAAQLRRALTAARLARRPPWETLARLGTDLGVPELAELAASVSLAGSEGAKVRASLTAKAAGMRTHQLTAAEADASAATERMSLPVVALFAGFLIFIGYPALAHVLTAL